MKLLVILCSHEFSESWRDNIEQLDTCMKQLPFEVEYCGISAKDDFHVYDSILKFKYKRIDPSLQLSKLCNFFTDTKPTEYTWFMKVRPDIWLFEPIAVDSLSPECIHSRLRVYQGPKRIRYGTSTNGEGRWQHICDCSYQDEETVVVLDDMVFLFHMNVVEKGAFNSIEGIGGQQHEWFHTDIWKSRGIPLNPIGIHLKNVSRNAISGHVNMN